MSTYFELVSYLDNVVTYDINDEIVKNLNEMNVDLRGNRYNRFLNHILDILDYRINTYYKELHDRLGKIRNLDEFEDEFNNLLDEIDIQIKLSSISVIADEDHNKLVDFIKTNFNEILNRLKKYYENDSVFVHYIDKYYV